MDKELIERLARESGIAFVEGRDWPDMEVVEGQAVVDADDLAAFAALIAEECTAILRQQAAASWHAAACMDQDAILDRAASAIAAKFAR